MNIETIEKIELGLKLLLDAMRDARREIERDGSQRTKTIPTGARMHTTEQFRKFDEEGPHPSDPMVINRPAAHAKKVVKGQGRTDDRPAPLQTSRVKPKPVPTKPPEAAVPGEAPKPPVVHKKPVHNHPPKKEKAKAPVPPPVPLVVELVTSPAQPFEILNSSEPSVRSESSPPSRARLTPPSEGIVPLGLSQQE